MVGKVAPRVFLFRNRVRCISWCISSSFRRTTHISVYPTHIGRISRKIKNTINQIILDLDSGKVRVAEKINGEWVTHQHLKKAIMLSFRIYPMENLNGPYSSWYDKAHLLKGKTAGWTKQDHEKAGFRMVPNSPVRKGSFVGKNAVLMPCYVNIGEYIDEGTMIDTFARAGSCSQI